MSRDGENHGEGERSTTNSRIYNELHEGEKKGNSHEFTNNEK